MNNLGYIILGFVIGLYWFYIINIIVKKNNESKNKFHTLKKLYNEKEKKSHN